MTPHPTSGHPSILEYGEYLVELVSLDAVTRLGHHNFAGLPHAQLARLSYQLVELFEGSQ